MSMTSRSSSSIGVSASFESGGGLAASYKFFLNGSYVYGASLSNVTSTVKYYTFTGLSADTQYYFSCTYYSSTGATLLSVGDYYRTSEAPDTTAPTITSWTPSSIDIYSVTMYASASDNKGVSGFYFYLDGNLVGSTSSSGSTYYTFRNLSGNTTYSFGVKAYDINGNVTGLYVSYQTTLKPRPATFSWDSSKTYGATFNLTASEWNRLTSNINQVRSYKGYTSYSFSYAYSGNAFTADMYNQAVYAISSMSPPTSVPYTRSKGDTIQAYDINRLRDSINSVS